LLFGLWWYQERLRKKYAVTAGPTDSEITEDSKSQETSATIQEEEKTDEYVIIED
jgi:hypothetical protein